MIAVVILLLCLVAGAPIAVACVLSVSYVVLSGPLPDTIIAQRIFAGLDSSSILAVPLFILAGEIMNASGITTRIIEFARAVVGKVRSAFAQVNIWASVIFAGISGSAVADASALGRVFIPQMTRIGYPKSFAATLTAASSVIGPIIPPSIPIIVYAVVVSGVSVPAMFLAGVVPGLLLAAFLSIYVFIFVPDYEKDMPTPSLRERLVAMRRGILPVLMPLFIIVSIGGGFVTPTEAAALACIYALVIGMVIYRTIRLGTLPRLFATAMRDSSIVLLIIGAIALANWMLTRARVPQIVTELIIDNISNPLVFLLVVNLFLLLIGCFLEGIAAMLVLVPILHPIAVQMGIDPLHFGIVVVFNLMIGLITPPLGIVLFVVESVSKVGLGELIRRIWPFFLIEVVALFVITYFPWLVLALPTALGFR